jgi:hypothetical protein
MGYGRFQEKNDFDPAASRRFWMSRSFPPTLDRPTLPTSPSPPPHGDFVKKYHYHEFGTWVKNKTGIFCGGPGGGFPPSLRSRHKPG